MAVALNGNKLHSLKHNCKYFPVPGTIKLCIFLSQDNEANSSVLELFMKNSIYRYNSWDDITRTSSLYVSGH